MPIVVKESTPEDEEALDFLHVAIQLAKGSSHLAAILGVSQTGLSRWASTERVPKKYWSVLRTYVTEQRKIVERPRSCLDSIHLESKLRIRDAARLQNLQRR